MIDPEPILKAVQSLTMTEPDTVRDLVRRVEYVIKRGIPGAFVECGVWRGGSAMTMALTLKALGIKDRTLYLFDTFAGMTPPEEIDVDHAGTRIADSCYAPLEDVRHNMESTGYAGDILYAAGNICETVKHLQPVSNSIALLRLDTDWYKSTRAELEFFFPQVSPGGVVIVDDYGHWAGSRKATDEYLFLHGDGLKREMVGYSVLVLTKPLEVKGA